ncbi:hypothetical protein BC940DRAFT_150880 [Gongronella butleri]|nr:hypothetical protein BC940DRAFT_150880 [Gongronella butleri]
MAAVSNTTFSFMQSRSTGHPLPISKLLARPPSAIGILVFFFSHCTQFFTSFLYSLLLCGGPQWARGNKGKGEGASEKGDGCHGDTDSPSSKRGGSGWTPRRLPAIERKPRSLSNQLVLFFFFLSFFSPPVPFLFRSL